MFILAQRLLPRARTRPRAATQAVVVLIPAASSTPPSCPVLLQPRGRCPLHHTKCAHTDVLTRQPPCKHVGPHAWHRGEGREGKDGWEGDPLTLTTNVYL